MKRVLFTILANSPKQGTNHQFTRTITKEDDDHWMTEESMIGEDGKVRLGEFIIAALGGSGGGPSKMDVVGGGTVPVPEARETLQNERARRGQRTISLSLSFYIIRGLSGK